MRAPLISLWIAAAVALTIPISPLCGQGTFQNLGFESAQIIPVEGSPYYPYAVATSNALPGWSVFYGTQPQSEITYNDPALGATWGEPVGDKPRGHRGE